VAIILAVWPAGTHPKLWDDETQTSLRLSLKIPSFARKIDQSLFEALSSVPGVSKTRLIKQNAIYSSNRRRMRLPLRRCCPLRRAVSDYELESPFARGGVTHRRTVGRRSCCSRERDFRDINLTAEPPLFAAFIVRWVAPTSAPKRRHDCRTNSGLCQAS